MNSNSPIPPEQHPIVMPDLDLPDVTATLSVWLVPIGKRVACGDRIVEILAGDVTVDLSAPVDGVLTTQCAAEDERVQTGDVLGLIRAICATAKDAEHI